MLRYCVFAVAVLFYTISASPISQNGKYVTPDDPAQCANDLIDWCNGVHAGNGSGVSIISMTTSDQNEYANFFCISDSSGINCTRNGSPWLVCTSENQLFYKGEPVTKDSAGNAGICKAADKAFNDLHIQNLSNDNASFEKEFEKGMDFFRQQMKSFQENLKKVFSHGFPFGDNSDSSESEEIEKE
ncbi:u29-Nephitoxin-Nsp1j_1 [Caerostris darwini]|uniref:U29-Nephitoxin-Nsp1j_1 n=1 Tax=Caerostris darwini TaxID=1538125 RepID=A0AAV4U6H7_9ARAC|nr:u29-Nephitoxin-Nsp1j_1 [Caerostris darwini]